MNQKQEDFAQWLTNRMGENWRDIVCRLTTRHYTDTTDIPNLGDERCQWIVLGWVVGEWQSLCYAVEVWKIHGPGAAILLHRGDRFMAKFGGPTLIDAIEAAARELPDNGGPSV